MKKLDETLKPGLLKGTSIFVIALILLGIGLVFSVLYAVTVGSANLSTQDVYRIIMYEFFNVGDPEVLGKGAIHDIV